MRLHAFRAMTIQTKTVFVLFLMMAAFGAGFLSSSRADESPQVKDDILALANMPLQLVDNGWVPVLKPFPVKESAEEKAEIEYVKDLVAKRVSPESDQAILEHKADDVLDIFVQNKLFDVDKTPKTTEFIQMAVDDITAIVLREKAKFNRARPHMVIDGFTTLFDVPAHASYPGGHAAQSMIVALILSDLDVANADQYKNLAEKIGYHRELAGLHFPSDTKAGYAVAKQYLEEAKKSDLFKQKFEEAKKELNV